VFGRKKTIQKQYIIISQDDRGVRQRNLTRQRLFTFSAIAVVILAAVFFFSADTLTNVLYKSKLAKVKQNYSMLSTTLEDLQSEVTAMTDNMESIEEKERVSGITVWQRWISDHRRCRDFSGFDCDTDAGSMA